MLIKKERIPLLHIILIGILPSGLKKLIYKWKGYKIGSHVKFSVGSVVIGDEVEIGDNSNFGFFSIIRGKKIKIGRYFKLGSLSFIDTPVIEIDDDARINEQVYIGGLSSSRSMFRLGKRTIIMQLSYINPVEPIIIGDDSGIGGHCLLFTHGSWLSQLDGFPVNFAPITLGKNVWLPWRVFIMPGVEVGDNVVIGANSLVTKNVPPNSLVAGSPAKVIMENYPRKLNEMERGQLLKNIFNDFMEFLVYNNLPYSKTENDQGFEITVNKRNKKHIICYLNSKKDISISSDSLIIVDYPENPETLSKGKSGKMIISLSVKKRSGTSEIGEEFVKFISRYGVRFDRLD